MGGREDFVDKRLDIRGYDKVRAGLLWMGWSRDIFGDILRVRRAGNAIWPPLVCEEWASYD